MCSHRAGYTLKKTRLCSILCTQSQCVSLTTFFVLFYADDHGCGRQHGKTRANCCGPTAAAAAFHRRRRCSIRSGGMGSDAAISGRFMHQQLASDAGKVRSYGCGLFQTVPRWGRVLLMLETTMHSCTPGCGEEGGIEKAPPERTAGQRVEKCPECCVVFGRPPAFCRDSQNNRKKMKESPPQAHLCKNTQSFLGSRIDLS